MARIPPLLTCLLVIAVALGSSYSAPIFAKDRSKDGGATASKTQGPNQAVGKAEPEIRVPRVFTVGRGQEYLRLSELQKVVRSGDRIEIEPGTYIDCVTWPKEIDGLTIEGKDVVIRDKSCGGKGIFVVAASNVIIRGITFEGAKVPDHNGAGIRAEGHNLLIDNSQFIDNEDGILANSVKGSTITIHNSFFQGNGACITKCAHGVYVNRVGLLRIENSEFVGQHVGHHIKSRAMATELVGDTIHDGPAGNSSYLVDLPNGGKILISGSTFEKGPRSENRATAIRIGEENHLNLTPEIRIENNTFKNELSTSTTFVRNETATAATLRGNKLQGEVQQLRGPGAVD